MFRFAGFRQSHFLCNLCNLIHSDGNCLTVAFTCVVVMLFDCVCQSVTKVQEHALAGVELIVLNNDSLDIYTAIDNFGQIFLQIFK